MAQGKVSIMPYNSNLDYRMEGHQEVGLFAIIARLHIAISSMRLGDPFHTIFCVKLFTQYRSSDVSEDVRFICADGSHSLQWRSARELAQT